MLGGGWLNCLSMTTQCVRIRTQNIPKPVLNSNILPENRECLMAEVYDNEARIQLYASIYTAYVFL